MTMMMKMRSPPYLTTFNIILVLLLSCSCFTTTTEAYVRIDPSAHISIKWDLINWTPDGYVAVVTIYNLQKYRSIKAPGWKLGWTWAGKEVIWSIVGAQATEQGDCSKLFKGIIPRCCKKKPTIVDLKPGVPYNWQVENCCKGGLLSKWSHDGDNHNPPHANSISGFQISVGLAGTTNSTVKRPRSFVFKAPKDSYICGPAKIVKPTIFITPDKRRTTLALMTWNVTCVYAGPQRLA